MVDLTIIAEKFSQARGTGERVLKFLLFSLFLKRLLAVDCLLQWLNAWRWRWGWGWYFS